MPPARRPADKRWTGLSAVGLLAAALSGLAGCGGVGGSPPADVGFFVSSPRDVSRLGRVVLIELSAVDECPPDTAWETTRALAAAIQARGLFHVDVVRRSDPACRDLPLDGIEALTLEQMAAMRKALDCQAVLFGRVSHFQPFPRMQLGLYLKLMNLNDGRLVWGVDHVWDSRERNIERRIDAYFYREVRSGYDPLGPELVLKSPRAFERFVSYEVAGTLPDRPAGEKSAVVARRSLK